MDFSQRVIYYAGLFDGDGSVAIREVSLKARKEKGYHTYSVRCQITNNCKYPLNLLLDDFGGKIYVQKRFKIEHNDTYVWCISSKASKKFLIAIEPFAIIKRPQIHIALKFQRNIEKYTKKFGGRGGVGNRLSEEIWIWRKKMKSKIEQLKKNPLENEANSVNSQVDNAELNQEMKLL